MDFYWMQETRVLRILIEGNPGYGKTTLALKMASDWALKTEYMSQYQLVFLIQLRHFHVRKLWNQNNFK